MNTDVLLTIVDNLADELSKETLVELTKELAIKVVELQNELDDSTNTVKEQVTTIGLLSSEQYEKSYAANHVQQEQIDGTVEDLCAGMKRDEVMEKIVRSSRLSDNGAKALVDLVKKTVDKTLMIANGVPTQ